MKKYVFSSMLLGGLLMASCSDDVFEAPVQEEVQNDYSKNFVEKFGKIDPSQDWTVAKVETITFNGGASRTTGEGNDVVIYGKYGNRFKIVGSFENTTAQEFDITVPEYVDEFIATVNNEVYPITVNNISYNSTASRTYMDAIENVWKPLSDPKEFPLSDLDPYFDLIPEGEDNRNNVNIAKNFNLYNEGTETIKIYPVYWCADYHHRLGIYYIEENNGVKSIVYKPIYKNKVGDNVLVDGNSTDGQNNSLKVKDETREVHTITSEGFEVTLPAGKMFGFYLEVYANGSANRPMYVWHSDASLNTDGQPHAAFTQALGNNNRRFLSFEDAPITWTSTSSRCSGEGRNIHENNRGYRNPKKNPNGWQGGSEAPEDNRQECVEDGRTGHSRPGDGNFHPKEEPGKGQNVNRTSDCDLNDIVFVIETQTEAMEFEPHEWILAIEDLGDTDDYDFNDIVFRVKHVGGEKTATVTPLAAGGTLETYLYQNMKMVTRTDENGTYDEFHELMGATEGTYPMINTYSAGKEGSSIIIDVEEDFTMALQTKNVPESMGNFTVKVIGKDGQANTEIYAPKNTGSAPQMICVPANWAWPKERKSIELAYPKFIDWVNNANYYEWVNYYDNDLVIKQ